MPDYVVCMATTAVVEQGGVRVSIAKEALDSLSDQVSGERALPFCVEHDPLCMPIGKVKEAWIERIGTEYAAMARVYVEDTVQELRHAMSGSRLVRLSFSKVPKPFVRELKRGQHDSIVMSIDRANLGSPATYNAFVDSVKAIDPEIVQGSIGRRSLVPEPLIQFIVSNVDLGIALSVGLWTLKRAEKFLRYTVDETLRKAADGISDRLSSKITEVVKAY